MQDRIANLDDATAIRVLRSVASAHRQGQASATELTPELGRALRDEFGVAPSGRPTSEGDLDRQARLPSAADGVSVSLPNHAAMGRVFELRDELADRQPGEPHPFVNAEAYRAALALFVKNAEAKLVAEKAGTAVDPIAELTRAMGREQ